MSTTLSIPEIEGLVLNQGALAGDLLSSEQVHVFESPDAASHAIVVQILARRPKAGADWARSRLRLSQWICDRLLDLGDDRYPLIEIF